MEVFIEAKKAGVIRHIGFSAHSEEAALAAMERYNFDSAMFPVNLLPSACTSLLFIRLCSVSLN